MMLSIPETAELMGLSTSVVRQRAERGMIKTWRKVPHAFQAFVPCDEAARITGLAEHQIEVWVKAKRQERPDGRHQRRITTDRHYGKVITKGLAAGKNMTEIAKEIGISRQRVSQLVNRYR